MGGETNRVKWQGIRPVSPVENIQVQLGVFETTVAGVTRTIISKSAEGAAGTIVVHEVTALKTFYLCSCYCGADSGANDETHLCVRNAVPVIQYHIIGFTTTAATPMAVPLTFNPPLPIPADWDIVIITDADHADGFVFGWEQ